MTTTRSRLFPALLSMTVAFAFLALAAADPPVQDPTVVPPQPPEKQAFLPPVMEQPSPLLATSHRQVSRLPLTREYRSVPAGDAATLAVHENISSALARVLQGVEFAETPLRDVVHQFHEILGVPVVVDVKALDDAGVDLELPVSFSSRGTTSRAALRRILGPLDLTCVIRDESLVITTKEAGALEIRLYPLPLGYCARGVVDLQTLIGLICNTVAPATWNTVGGQGSIQPLGDGAAAVLVVSQTPDVHEEIEGLLRGLNELDLTEFGTAADGPTAKKPTVRVYLVADEAARRDLGRQLVEICNASLSQGADPAACVTIVGDCLVVHSVMPEFHALAGQLVRAVAGEQDVHADQDGLHGPGNETGSGIRHGSGTAF